MFGKVRSKYMLTFLLGCALTSGMIGCSSNAVSPASPNDSAKTDNGQDAVPKQGGTIRIGIPDEPDSLDAHKAGMSVSDEVLALLGGALVYQDPQSADVQPYLAQSYSISPDGKTWTFKIRPGVAFHDGTPLTASAFKQTYERAVAKETASKIAGGLLTAVKTISAPDEETLIFELNQPSAPLLLSLTDPGFMQPLSPEAIQKAGDRSSRNPVGVGPWKFESWSPGESIKLIRNDSFHWPEPIAENQGPVRPESLELKIIKDRQTRLAALESGSIDIAKGVSAKDAKRFRENDKFYVLEQTSPAIGLFIEMNLRNDIFQDRAVRQALNMAVNKEAIIKAVLQGEGVAAHGPVPPTLFGFDTTIEQYAYRYNLEEAKKLLEGAGWIANEAGIREKNGKTLSFTLLSTERWSKDVQLIQQMLREIGVELKINKMDYAALLEKAAQGDFDMTAMSYTHVDPDVVFYFAHSSQIGSFNHSRIRDQELDILLEKGQTTVDNVERKKIYVDVQKRMVEQGYWIPVYIEKEFFVINKRVKNVKLLNNSLYYQDSWVND
ncbi:ABC transporter substrate-binding protein [Brevibacillus borstelensis]|uniref:ABC transporter substrate-binding protein n=1 Tax=Brevibacillus borstelensis TaxID=45462 RepID=UPI0030C404E0